MEPTLKLGSWVLLSAALAVVFGFLSVRARAAVEKNPVVFTSKVKLTELSETLAYPARVEPRIRASVLAETDGVVSSIIAPLGSHVRAMAPLIVIKNTDPIYNYAPMVLTAAVDGVVSKVEVTEGSRVARGDKLVLITDPEQLRVEVEVTAYDLPSIRTGQTAELKVPGTENEVSLKVKGVSPFVDPSTGTASVELELSRGQKSAHLPPLGVLGRVYFRANIRKGISVPDAALTYRGKDPYIRIITHTKAATPNAVEENIAHLVAVTIGRKESGQVEILKGLKSGDEFIERSSGFVTEGEAVDVQSADQH